MPDENKNADILDDLGLDELAQVASEIDQESVEEAQSLFPLVQWINGSPSKKKEGGVPWTGGWFIAASSAAGLEQLPGWNKDVFITRGGTEVPGFFRKDIEFAFLLQRRHWRVVVADKGEERTLYFPWGEYDRAKDAGGNKKPSGAVQWLVWVKDLDDLNPMVITTKGFVSKELTGSRNNEGVGGAFSARVVGTVNNALHASGNSNNLPWRAFWMHVGPRINPDGSPEYTKVGQGNDTSTITLPALYGVKRGAKAEEVKGLFIGKELLAKLNDVWKETRCQEWAAAWNKVQAEQAQVEQGTNYAKPKILDSELDGPDSSEIDDEQLNF